MNGKRNTAKPARKCLGSSRRVVVLSLLALLAAIEAGWGQQQQDQRRTSTVTFTFDFSPPGARSLGLGGAFLGLADDATAAYTNPAGLTNLTVGGPEVAMELRSRNVTELHPTGGHILGGPSGIGLDTRDEPFLQKDEGKTTGLSFLSVGYVLPGGASLAFYRHELLNFEMQSESQGLFAGPGPYSGGNRTFASQTVQKATVVNTGLSGAYEVDVPFTPWQDSLSLGLGLSLYQLDLDSRLDYFGGFALGCSPDPQGGWVCPPGARNIDRGPDGFYGPNQFLGDTYRETDADVGDDTDFGLSLGALWKIGRSEQWRVGGVYRQGPRFSTRILILSRSGDSADPGSFTVPDSYGIGGAYSTNEGRTKLALDYNCIRYSQRLAELSREPQRLSEALGLGNEPPLEMKDSKQLHVGFEHVFPIVEPALIGTLRLGAWREPFHDLAYVGGDQDLKELINSGPRKARNHYAVGLGLVFKEDFQVDLAADFSDLQDVVSLSFVKFL